VSWYSTVGLGTARLVGTTTQGPETGTQTIKPSHSSAACAGPEPAVRTALKAAMISSFFTAPS
jgi:hypothetical protein